MNISDDYKVERSDWCSTYTERKTLPEEHREHRPPAPTRTGLGRTKGGKPTPKWATGLMAIFGWLILIAFGAVIALVGVLLLGGVASLTLALWPFLIIGLLLALVLSKK